MKYTTVGNCPYCDCEIGGISCGWGMSPESWEIMKQNHNAGHPENTPPTPPVTKKEGNTDFVKQAGKWHYADCHFINSDEGVCNCPKKLKPATPPVSEDKKVELPEEILFLGDGAVFDGMSPEAIAIDEVLIAKTDEHTQAINKIINSLRKEKKI